MNLDVDWQVYHSHPTQGHAFRDGSLLPGDLTPEEADLILDFTDRTPGYGDFRTSWAPYPGGRRAGRFYVVTSTRPDSGAVRPGSVVTQALLVPLERFAQLPDLQSALEAVSAPWPAPGPRTLTLADSAPADPNVGYVMTEAFIRAADQQVAVVGEELWAEAVSGLWRALWPGARQDFQFRAFETPHYLVGNPDLLLVPAPGQAWAPPAWTGVAVRALVSSGTVPAALEFVATSAAQIDASVRGLRRINVLSAALRNAPNGARETIYALTLLERAPLHPLAKRELAQQLSVQVSREIAHQTASALTLLADVPDDLAGELVDPVFSWVSVAVASRPEEARELAVSASARPWLSGVIRDVLSRQAVTTRHAGIFWDWWTDGGLRALSVPALDRGWDEALSRSAPPDAERRLPRALALAQGWPRTFGVIVGQAADLDAVTALPGPLMVAALDGARAASEPAEFVRWAVRQPGPQPLEAAVQALRDVPALLVEADLHEGRWLDLWTAALPHWSEIDPGHRRADVLTLVAKGMPVPPALLEALAQHGGGNLLAHPQRSLLLSRLPAEYRSQTADAYLRCQDDPGVPEGVLLNAVQERLLLVPPSPSVVRRLITLPALTAEAQRAVERHLAQSLQADDEPLLARLAPAQFARLLQGAPQAVRWHLRRHLDPIDTVRLAHQLSRPVDGATWWAALEALLMTSEIDALSVWRELSWPTRDFPVRGSQRDHWQHGLTEIRHASYDTLDRFLGVLAHRRPHSMFPVMQATFREIRRPH